MFSYTSALAYFMPLLGGILADVLWGRYRTILIFSAVYVVGSTALALNAAAGGGVEGAMAALVLISIGTGGIKPCVSAFGADQLGEAGGDAARERYFSSFYVAINVGSMFAFVVTPFLRVKFGFSAAFGAAAVVLGAALAFFVSGRGSYRHVPPSAPFYRALGSRLAGRLRLMALGGGRSYKQLAEGSVKPTAFGQPDADAEAAGGAAEGGPSREASAVVDEALAALGRLLPVLMLMPCFWALFDQQGSSWVLQAKALQLSGVLPFGIELSPETLLVLNPIFVTVLVPLTRGIFERWRRWFGAAPPASTARMFVGMLLASLAFLCSSALQSVVEAGPAGSVSVLWQVPQIFLITLAEVLVSVESLNFFYSRAPAEAKAAVSALSLLTVSFGDILCGLLYQALSSRLSLNMMLLTFSALMAGNAAVFFRVTRPWDERSGASSR